MRAVEAGLIDAKEYQIVILGFFDGYFQKNPRLFHKRAVFWSDPG
jgi:hypothetical protein